MWALMPINVLLASWVFTQRCSDGMKCQIMLEYESSYSAIRLVGLSGTAFAGARCFARTA